MLNEYISSVVAEVVEWFIEVKMYLSLLVICREAFQPFPIVWFLTTLTIMVDGPENNTASALIARVIRGFNTFNVEAMISSMTELVTITIKRVIVA